MQNSFVTQSLITVVVVGLVVFRFAVRELKPRVVKSGVLWLRPIILAVLTVWLIWTTLAVDPAGTNQLILALLSGGVLGAITGILIVRFTTFSPAPVPNAVTASGSQITFGIWVVAFVLRLAARFVVPHGADPRTQLPMNTGTVTLVTVAFVIIAIAFQNAITRYGRSAAASAAAPVPTGTERAQD